MIIFDILVIIFLFTLFGFSHSFLASNKLKTRIAGQAGTKIAFYRIFYNTISLLFFYVIYNIAPHPDVIIYDLKYPFDFVMVGIQLLGLAGLVWAVTDLDTLEFLGISQVIRYFNGTYNVKDLDEKANICYGGAYRYMRHPIYFFFIIFLGFRSTMDLFYLLMYIFIVVYFFIGSYYEEKKLIEKLGEQYKEYQSRVPRIFPFRFGNK